MKGKDEGALRTGEHGAESWVQKEGSGCRFNDQRLDRRFTALLQQLTEGVGQSIPFACQDWANTKAAYRFLSNPKVNEADILSGHFASTRERVKRTDGLVLVLHDTTEFSYTRDDVQAIGITHEISSGPWKPDSRVIKHTVCGILMHSSLVVTTEGLPLGIAAIKFWTRKKFKGTQALKNKINPTRVPIEEKESQRWLDNLQQSSERLEVPQRCVHVGDRESDIYELFCAAQDARTHFLFRTCVDRIAGDGTHTIADEMSEVRCKGLHRIGVRDRQGNVEQAALELRYQRMHILPPVEKRKRYPELDVTIIHAQERTRPKGRERIDWKLITDLPVRSRGEAIEKLNWYAMRWRIETFHKILKSGCKAEESKLRTAQRLTNLVAMFCILSWRIFWLTMLNRTSPDSKPDLVFTAIEIKLLDQLVQRRPRQGVLEHSLASYLIRLARLGGYLDRANDLPPGNIVIWRGMARMSDLVLGAQIGAAIVGN